MRNKLTDLNNHLFAQLERLNDEEKFGDELKEEIHRSKAVSDIASKIVDNARVQLDAMKFTGLPQNKNINLLIGEDGHQE